MLKKARLTVTTTGSAGSATGSGQTEDTIDGRIVRVDVDYHASAPATTDLTLAQASELIATNIVSLTDNNSDTQLFPTVQVTDNGGTGRTYDTTEPVVDYYPAADELVATVSGCDALDPAVTLEIYYLEE